ncbi:MAG: sigma-70 family RNA polymerase sigma factor [Planctomycetes bacterium]|nr:sigma-70 family RNA polymerase sigma factor [Planctomycetota bacterium]
METGHENIDACISAVLSGEINCFEEFILACQQEVWKVVASARFDHATSSDLTQKTFIQAYEQLDKYKPGTNPIFWIKEIARNLVRKEIRTRRSRSRIMEAYRQRLEERMHSSSQHETYTGKYESALSRCMRELSERGREAIRLHYTEGKSFAAISEALDTTAVAAKQLVYRLRTSLRTCIEMRMANDE